MYSKADLVITDTVTIEYGLVFFLFVVPLFYFKFQIANTRLLHLKI